MRDGAIGSVHAARAHYGNAGSTWAAWYHQDRAATLGDVGVYNLKSLAALLGPVTAVPAASATAVPRRTIAESGGRRARSRHLAARAPPRRRSALIGAGLSRDLELPPPWDRALRHPRQRQPAGRRLGSPRHRALSQGHRQLGADRARRRHLALDRRPARGGGRYPSEASAAGRPAGSTCICSR